MSRFLGIDFSGNHLMWRPGCSRSNVWISDVRKIGDRLVLDRLMRVFDFSHVSVAGEFISENIGARYQLEVIFLTR